MKKNCIAMLLAGGQGSRLYALTQKVAKPSVPFGGKYRIIDFPLSNCANSGIDTVGVLTQYRPLQLNSYIGNGQPWDLDVADGGVYILPPYQSFSPAASILGMMFLPKSLEDLGSFSSAIRYSRSFFQLNMYMPMEARSLLGCLGFSSNWLT